MAHLVQQDSKRPHIDEVVMSQRFKHLRRHVLQRSAESLAFAIRIFVQFSTPAEITDFQNIHVAD